MRACFYKILVLFCLVIVLSPANAQNFSYTSPAGITLGFGLGSSYQISDIKNSEGIGFDFRLGTPLYLKQNALIAIDWRFRFLNGYHRAYDHRIEPDGTYPNIHLTHFNYDLEFVFTLNRLRERTGIILSGFLGAGATHGITSSDLLDASGNAYDYSAILPNRDPSAILSDIDQLVDRKFETRVLGRAAILPTAGIYLGYEFTPHFAMGVEHKMNFSLSEHNTLFGFDMDNKVIPGSSLDFINYTSLVFRWALGGRSIGTGSAAAYTPDPQPVAPVTTYPPQVDITDPYTNPFETPESSVKVTARILNISRKENITVQLNGQNRDFMFYSSINRIEIVADLQLGSNSLYIQCRNEAGSDSDELILIYRQPSVTNPPLVRFVNPSSGIEVEQDRFTVQIQSNHIASKEDVTLTVNGNRIQEFEFDRNGNIRADLNLLEGRNEILVSGRNPDGIAEDRTSITYIQPEQGYPPEVRFLTPSSPESGSYDPMGEILAEILGVASYRDIRLDINGVGTNEFSFNPATGRLTASVPLITPSTQIQIHARNPFGSDTDSRIIFRESPPVEILPCPKPILSLYIDEFGANELVGTIRNVRDNLGIQLTVNGFEYTNWRFNPATGELRTSFNFEPGTHHIELHASNGCGTVIESRTLVIEAPCIPPFVRLSVSEVAGRTATHQIKAKVEQVSIRSNITILVNGSVLPNFQFNPATELVTANLNLDPGSHDIVVVGMNDCGRESVSETIVIEAPCELPAVSLSISEITSQNLTHEFSARALNVQNRSEVSLLVDGAPFTNFRFNPASGQVSGGLRLDPGSHLIVLTANNACGSDTESSSVVVEEPCIPPTVNFGVSEINSPNASHQLRGKTGNVKSKSQVTLNLDGRPDSRFQFNPATGEISGNFMFTPGSHTIVVSARNECGTDSKSHTLTITDPCIPPVVNFEVSEVNSPGASHQLRGRIQNVESKDQVSLNLDGRPDSRFQFISGAGEIRGNFNFTTGSHTIVVTAQNECGADSKSYTFSVEERCLPPKVSIEIAEINSPGASHQLRGKISNLETKNQITLYLDGRPDNRFQFNPGTGEISGRFNFTPGSHTIEVVVRNECGTDRKSQQIRIVAETDPDPGPVINPGGGTDPDPGGGTDPDPGGGTDPDPGQGTDPNAGWVRINPGNSSWEFCLQTPRGTYNRDNLRGSGFAYKGRASSLYFKPIGGGGNAVVNGRSYKLNPGQYYLFRGTLNVEVTNKKQGAMGQWSVFIESNSPPATGKGNNRPKSPCETNDSNSKPGNQKTENQKTGNQKTENQKTENQKPGNQKTDNPNTRDVKTRDAKTGSSTRSRR